MHLADVVQRPVGDREQETCGTEARPAAVRTRVLDHHLVEPCLHPGARLTALTIVPVVALDASRDTAEADLLSFLVVALDLRLRRGRDGDLRGFETVENDVSRLLGQLLPGRVERERHSLRETVHHPAVPRVRVVAECLAHEASAPDAPLRIGDEQLGVRELVNAKPPARAARAGRRIEDEELRLDVAVHEVVRGAAQSAIESLGVRLGRALEHVHCYEPIAHEECRRDPRLDRLLVFAVHHESVDDGVHVTHLRLVQRELGREVHELLVDDEPPDPLLPHVGEDEVELFAVDLEHRRTQLDLGARGQSEDRFEDLARRFARCYLAGARAVGDGDGRVEKVQVARNVGHRSDGRARVACHGLLLDRDDRRESEHEVDVGLRDLRDESFGEARERLHVTPLPFGVDGVEREARLSGTRKSRDDDEAVARDLDRDVLEVVDARPLHGNRCAGGGASVIALG